ncbi:MAG TPA: hypothetical protein VNY06_05560 [Methylocella sp.]|nr:hypothetical protein [Methylocella sp.]
MLVVDAGVFDMSDQRAFGHHHPGAIGKFRNHPVDGRAQGNEICRDHGIVANDFAMCGEHCGNAVPRIAAAMAIFKAVPEDLRFFAGGAGGGGQAPAPEGLVSPTPAGTSSRNGKVIFLKNILRPIVKIMPFEPTTMSLAPVLKAQLKSFELQRFRGECRRLERRAAQLPSDQPHAGKIKPAKDCDLFSAMRSGAASFQKMEADA